MTKPMQRSIEFWFLFGIGVLILLMLIFGQMMSFINYEFTVAYGLQESVDVIGEMGVAFNKAFGVGDTLIYLPLVVLGLVGLWSGKKWGILTMTGAMAITAYWPVVNIFSCFLQMDSQSFISQVIYPTQSYLHSYHSMVYGDFGMFIIDTTGL